MATTQSTHTDTSSHHTIQIRHTRRVHGMATMPSTQNGMSCYHTALTRDHTDTDIITGVGVIKH